MSIEDSRSAYAAQEDSAIVELYWQRDELAIRKTADRYGALCMRVAMNVLGNRADAEECVNDTYLRAWNAIPPARPRHLSAFLLRITRNLALDRYRAARREKRGGEITLMLSELGDCIPAPEDTDAGELLADIKRFLSRLDELDRNLFVGRYFHAYEVKRLAAGYGLSANAVSLRLHKTREKLRVYLNERGYHV